MTLPWPWNWDSRPQGWYLDGDRTRFGPLPERVRVLSSSDPRLGQRGLLPRGAPKETIRERLAQIAQERPQEAADESAPSPRPKPEPPPAPEQRAASALLNEVHEAEARRHVIDPWRERRQ